VVILQNRHKQDLVLIVVLEEADQEEKKIFITSMSGSGLVKSVL
jgi:hypothetical protein